MDGAASPQRNESTGQALLTWCIVALSALSFSSKGVIVKLMYPYGIEPVSVLALRLGMSLPVFIAAAWWCDRRSAHRISAKEWLQMLGLGFIGYYLSAVLDFTALQYISVGLERMVLYTYPGLVLLGSVWLLGQRLQRGALLALAVAYVGVALAFTGEVRLGGEHVLLGVLLVMACALSYASFVVCASRLIPRIGGTRFMGIVVSLSGIFMLGHEMLLHGSAQVLGQAPAIYGYAALLAGLGTLLPSFTLGVGLRRAGPQRFAIIGTIGPVATIIMAWAILGEALAPLQALGFALTLGGGLWLSLLPRNPRFLGSGGAGGGDCRRVETIAPRDRPVGTKPPSCKELPRNPRFLGSGGAGGDDCRRVETIAPQNRPVGTKPPSCEELKARPASADASLAIASSEPRCRAGSPA